MSDETKTREQLLAELASVRRQLEEVHQNTPVETSGHQAVLDNLEAFPQIINFIKEVFYVRDVATDRWTYISPALEDIYGCDPQELLDDQEKILNIIHPEDREAWLEAVRRQKQQEAFFNQEYRIMHPSGEIRWIHARSFPVHDSQGHVVRLVGIAEDITDRKRFQEQLRKSESRYRQLFEAMTAGFALHEIMLDEEGRPSDYRFLEVNPAFERLTGFSAEQVVGKTLLELFPEAERHWVYRYGPVALTGDSITFENYSAALGKHYEVVAYSPAQGRFATIFHDITERKLMEQAQREAILRHQEVVKAANVGMWDWDLLKNKVTYSAEWKKQIGYREDEIGDDYMEWESRVHPDDLRAAIETIQQSIAQCSKDHRGEFRFRHKDGSYRWIITQGSVLTDDEGRPIRMLGSHVDITDRKRNEQELHRRVKFEQLVYQVSSALARAGGNEAHEAIERALASVGAFTGADRAYVFRFLNGHALASKTHEWCAAGIEPQIQNLARISLEEELPWFREQILKRRVFNIPDVDSLPPEAELERYHFQEQDIKSLIVVPIENTGRLQGFLGFDAVGHRRAWAQEDETLLRFLGETISHVLQREQAEKEKILAEAQLRQAQKMEAVGTLAGGIAHDFNNILTALAGYAELALDEAMNNRTAPEELKQILKASHRAAALVKQILTFSRKMEPTLKPVDLNKEVMAAVSLLRQTIPRMIEIDLVLSEDIGLIKGDENQIQQVLLNLTSNAKDAMPDGGRILFKTERVFIETESCQICHNAFSGDYVLLSVSDTGVGMDAQALEKIFDPFYTTKEVGKGTGLGLATVFGIMAGHGAHGTVESQPGQGTTFNLYLPIPEEQTGLREEKEFSESVSGGRETILVVDDEEGIRDIAHQFLHREGYTILAASNGEDALKTYRKLGDQIDLVILDLSMPGMGGHRCLAKLTAMDPSVKVIIASGYSSGGDMNETMAAGATALLSKPFSRLTILRTVRQVLDS